MKRTVLLLSVVVALTGCVEYRWVKPGGSEHDRQMQLTACEAQGLKDLPPDNVVENAYSTSSLKDNADDKKIDENTETRNRITDANDAKRGVLVDNCMLQRGWEKVVINQ